MTKTTEDVITLLEGHHTAVQAMHEKTDGRLNEIGARLTAAEQEIVRRGGAGGGGSYPQNSFGAALTKHPEFSALAALADKRGKITLNVKAMITSLPDSGGALVAPDVRADPLMLQRRRLFVRSLIKGGQTTSNLIQYPRQTVRTLDARVVSEGAAKPESTIEFTIENAPVVTIATWTKASRQILADAPRLASTLDTELRYAVSLTEEAEFLFGDGTGIHPHGIVPQASAFDTTLLTSISHVNKFDAVRAAITQSQIALLPATGIVMNDADLGSLQTIKNSNGDYIAPGGPLGPPIRTVWGVPVVGTPVMPVNSFLVGAFLDGAEVADREDVNMMVATENEDDFTHNLATLLVEERLAFWVKRPAAFIYGSFPAQVT